MNNISTSRVSKRILLIFASAAFTYLAKADIVLSGVLQHGTVAGQNGQTAGSPIWNTLGGESSFSNIYLTQPNTGYSGSFLNTGNGSNAVVSFSLGVGTYNFDYLVMGFWDNNPGEYGLNLYFNGDTTNPAISAYSIAGVLSANATSASIATLSLNGQLTGITPTAPSLVSVLGGYSVSLTAYGFGMPGAFGSSAVDRVGNLDSLPDLAEDSIGRFSLVVTAIPEPADSSTILGLGAVMLCLFKGRRNK